MSRKWYGMCDIFVSRETKILQLFQNAARLRQDYIYFSKLLKSRENAVLGLEECTVNARYDDFSIEDLWKTAQNAKKQYHSTVSLIRFLRKWCDDDRYNKMYHA